MVMTKQKPVVYEDGFLDEVRSVPGAECVDWCVQCGMCAGSCPNVAWMDHSPRKMIALIRAGRRDDVLSSNSMGYCASCYLCTVRCPRGVQVTELMHALESLAARHGVKNGGSATPALHRAFVESVRNNGRVHEMGLVGRFYLRAKPLAALRMIPFGLKMLARGRVHLLPRRASGAKQLKAIVEKAQAVGGAR